MLITWLIIESLIEPFYSRSNKCFDCERQIDTKKFSFLQGFSTKCFSCEKELISKCSSCKKYKKKRLSKKSIMDERNEVINKV